MKKTKTNIAPRDLSVNVGQLGWLPANPRTWTQADVDRTSRSIAQDTDFLEDRPILAIQNEEGGYVVFAGNLRTTAAKGLALKSVPVVVYTPETEEDREAVKRRAMKDNGNFGAWDYDALANEWDDLPLAEFGIDEIPNVEKEVEKAKKDEEIVAKTPFTEVLGEEHNYIVLYFDNEVDWLQAQTLFDLHPVKALPTTKNGEQSLAFQKRIGTGRVLNGAKAIQKLLGEE